MPITSTLPQPSGYPWHPGRRSLSHYSGCLLGGAVGDALGWPVEFIPSMQGIREKFGPGGILDPVANAQGVFEITDDTQMTLFTAEGLLLAEAAGVDKPDFVAEVHAAYRCWLLTQNEALPGQAAGKGRLVQVDGLHVRRAPGRSCLSALRNQAVGSRTCPINHSKGCGAVMRMAPVGLYLQAPRSQQRSGPEDQPFQLGCDLGALTHGHPSGYLPAGCLAGLIGRIVAGDDLDRALDKTLKLLAVHQGSRQTLRALEAARSLAAKGNPGPETVARLGAGWVGEEALAIGVYCALVAKDDFAYGVRLAVNHGGDSDSTGSIAGNLLGALLGVEAIPRAWLAHLELRDLIESISRKLLVGTEEG